MTTDRVTRISRQQIVEEIKTILEPWLDVVARGHTGESQAHLITDMGLDSVGILQLMLGIEKAFNITIENHELDMHTLSSLNHLAILVEKKIREAN